MVSGEEHASSMRVRERADQRNTMKSRYGLALTVLPALHADLAPFLLISPALDRQVKSDAYRSSMGENFVHSWTASVLVTMGGQCFVCSGVGHAERNERSTHAKKTAVTNAYRQLFASLALVVLQNGKVAVQVLP
jgi:hypothetical protein